MRCHESIAALSVLDTTDQIANHDASTSSEQRHEVSSPRGDSGVDQRQILLVVSNHCPDEQGEDEDLDDQANHDDFGADFLDVEACGDAHAYASELYEETQNISGDEPPR